MRSFSIISKQHFANEQANVASVGGEPTNFTLNQFVYIRIFPPVSADVSTLLVVSVFMMLNPLKS